ncbi:MAG: HlyD family type I secretion periplasmic adaptor subunit [Boseongicola sp.]|nr:HlyD family type I secretion periplasmic adaptor subunit [Boseongicola sp.]
MTKNTTHLQAKLPLTIGFGAIVLMLGSLGAWGVGTQIAGAVVATGTIQVESKKQIVQHPDGGVVGEILARDGALVAAGEVLVRFDGTFLNSELTVIEGQLAELFARRVRLIAERDDMPNPDFEGLPTFATIGGEAIAELVVGQSKLFDARRASLFQEALQIGEQQSQIELQIEGTEAQLNALRRQLEYIAEERADVQSLFERGLIQRSRLLELQREEVRLLGDIGNLTSRTAEARSRIAALTIERLKLKDHRREGAITRLRDLGYSAIELEEKRISLSEQIARLEVRAPVAGVVFDSRVSALQSVVRPAEPMMYLVPADLPLEVSVRIDPIDVDQVYPGQTVALIFSAFNRRTTPDVAARVLRVSADAQIDETTGLAYYQAIVIPNRDAMAAVSDLNILPGMPVEAYLKTNERSPLSYLTEPLAVYFQRAFREE